jgi:hypothetical protein
LTASLTEAAWKPLGKGYQNFGEYFLRYCSRPLTVRDNPDLSMGLNAFSADEPQRILRSLPSNPVCMIQGISCPHNGTALRSYLQRTGVDNPSIHAIDILDVRAVARAAGFELADLTFHVADACEIGDWKNSSVQMLVQDHLLNCSPHDTHQGILREAARILDPRGVFMLNFSIDPPEARKGAMLRDEAENLLQNSLKGAAYNLEDVVGSNGRLAELKAALSGRVIGYDSDRLVLVTKPHGNFEFYSSFEGVKNLLSRAGLEFVFVSRWESVPEGLACVRYRTLVQHTKRDASR